MSSQAAHKCGLGGLITIYLPELQRDDFSVAPSVSTWQSHLKSLTQYQGITHFEGEYEHVYRKRIVEAVRKALPRATPD